MAFPITVELGWKMYYAVLGYARETWNVTQTHLATIASLETVEDLINYDYKSGYPEKLVF